MWRSGWDWATVGHEPDDVTPGETPRIWTRSLVRLNKSGHRTGADYRSAKQDSVGMEIAKAPARAFLTNSTTAHSGTPDPRSPPGKLRDWLNVGQAGLFRRTASASDKITFI